MNILKDHQIALMVNELTEACKTHSHAQCLRGELSRIVNEYLKEKPVIHYLQGGMTMCGIIPLTVGWEKDDQWSDNWEDVTCEECKIKL